MVGMIFAVLATLFYRVIYFSYFYKKRIRRMELGYINERGDPYRAQSISDMVKQ